MLMLQSLAFFCLTLFAITAGEEAPLGKYAHHVSIRYRSKHICSGSIINKRHILTSSSCIISIPDRDLTVVVGTNSLTTGGYSYRIQVIIKPDSPYDDIAILRTRHRIAFRRGVQKIDMDNHNEYAINSPLTVLGWELPPLGGMRGSAMLQEFSYRLYDRDLCRKKNDLFGRMFICIIDPTRQGLCNMDHGGGIIADGYLIGIYLNRDSCVDGGESKAHTPIYEYLNWIRSNSIVQEDVDSGVVGTDMTCNRNHDASYGAYKYHVSVRRYNEHICSGSIINKRFILTSQICVGRDSNNLYVVVGTNSLTNSGTSYKVEKIISHPGDDDYISLLQINRDINFNNLIQPIPMTSYNYESVGSRVTFTAFEKPSRGKSTNNKLQAFSWEIYDLKKCAKAYKDYFDQSSICTMDPCHENICNMDYGGAVVTNGVQIGMLFHPDGCTPNNPIVHHRIHHYAGWIKQNSDLKKITRPPVTSRPIRHVSYPYHVSIRRHDQHICSGSIINNRHILTSNNCILSDAADSLFVMAGTNSLREAGALYAVQEKIPTYDHKFDIAILRTSGVISFYEDVQPIPIVSSSYITYGTLLLTGWQRQIVGQTTDDKLRQISYQTYDRNLCKEVIPFLSEAYMCSTNPSYRKVCDMDYGGPIVANGVQVALNPFGVRCENNQGPYLYLPLQQHSQWIERNSRV